MIDDIFSVINHEWSTGDRARIVNCAQKTFHALSTNFMTQTFMTKKQSNHLEFENNLFIIRSVLLEYCTFIAEPTS